MQVADAIDRSKSHPAWNPGLPVGREGGDQTGLGEPLPGQALPGQTRLGREPVVTPAWPGPCWLASGELTEAQWALVEDFAASHGRQHDSFLAVRASGRRFFFASDRKGIVSAVQRGRRLGVFGGILGGREHWGDIIDELMRACADRRLHIGFFAIEGDLRDVLAARGFQANKFGQGAIVDLTKTDWKGKPYEWVRRQSSFCSRQGLAVQECRESLHTPADWHMLIQELQAIEAQFLTDRSHGSHLRHVVGRFSGKLEARQRLFTARHGQTGAIEAYVICNPSLDGQRWVLECFRRRLDATRGVIAFLLHQVMQQLKTEGVRQADLCMVPFVNCEAPKAGDHWLSRQAICFVGRHLNWIYDAQGLFHFKSRFRPDLHDVYVCAYPRIDAGWMHFIISECGFLKVKPANVARQIREHFAKRLQRSNMATATAQK